MDARRYVRASLRAAALALGLLATFNVVVDAYGIFRRWRIPHLRTEPEVWSRVSAAERIADDCNVVFMGSSRVVHGFGPHMPRWGSRNVCNGALAGTSIQEQRQVFDFVLRQREVRQVVLFIDFHMFHASRGTHGDFAQSRFNPNRSRLAHLLWATTSLDATTTSFRILGHPLTWLDDLHPPVGQLKANRTELYRFFKNPKLYLGWQGDPETMGILLSMLDDADRANIKVTLVIPPVHAILLETEAMTGVWDSVKTWKRALVEHTATRRKPVAVWDFSTYSEPVVTPMPLRWEDPLNPWWIDVSHQSMQLGWMTMNRISEATLDDGGEWDEDFGVLLTPDNLEAHLERVDDERLDWRFEHADQLAWLEAYAKQLQESDDPTIAPGLDDVVAPVEAEE
jgi:hypothetical protein